MEGRLGGMWALPWVVGARSGIWQCPGSMGRAGLGLSRAGLCWDGQIGQGRAGCSQGHAPLRLSPGALPQVQRFLQAAGQAPDLAERYCRLYQRLRGATEELFGQQAAFVLALGQGFAGALLQLSFLTALHVSRGARPRCPGHGPGSCPGPRPRDGLWVGCPVPPEAQTVPSSGVWCSWQPPVCSQPCPLQVSEQFARYLDVQVQELRRAGGSSGPLERLQQFLEPFVVFSGLELAHTFEHFYR